MFDRDFPAALIPLAVVVAGLDWITPGHPLSTLILSFLSQNGF